MASIRASTRASSDDLLARFAAAFAASEEDDVPTDHSLDDDAAVDPATNLPAAFLERYQAAHSIAKQHVRLPNSSRKYTALSPATDYQTAVERIRGMALRNQIELREEVSDSLKAALDALDQSMSRDLALARESRALQESRRLDKERRIAHGERLEDLPSNLKGKQRLVEDPAITPGNAGELLGLLVSPSDLESELLGCPRWTLIRSSDGPSFNAPLDSFHLHKSLLRAQSSMLESCCKVETCALTPISMRNISVKRNGQSG